MNKKWSINEEKYISDNVGVLTDSQIAEKLTEITGRPVTLNSVRRKRQRLGLKKAQGRGYCKLTSESFYDKI